MKNRLIGGIILALIIAAVYFAWLAGAWCWAHVTFAGFKKVTSFLLFWAFFISLIRMWWKIGSYYGRKS